jgi:hypothetical protein
MSSIGLTGQSVSQPVISIFGMIATRLTDQSVIPFFSIETGKETGGKRIKRVTDF